VKLEAALDERLRRAMFSPSQWARLASLAQVRVVDPRQLGAGQGPEQTADTEVLITGWGCPPLTPTVLDARPRLALIVHTGGSTRAFIGPDVFERGIQVCSQTARNAEPVAEFCLAQILLAAKHVPQATRRYADTRTLGTFDEIYPWADPTAGRETGTLGPETPDSRPRDRAWGSKRGAGAGGSPVRAPETAREFGVFGTTVGLIGYGQVCRRLVELLRPFSVRILLASPYLDEDTARTLGVELVSPAAVMSTADVISIHLGATPDNHGAITADLLRLIKPGATFINTARGIVVDEPALIGELRTGRFDAVLDVTWPEQPAADSPLWTLPNVTLTPHWAGSLGRELFYLGEGAVDNVEQYIAGRPLTGLIAPTLAPYLA